MGYKRKRRGRKMQFGGILSGLFGGDLGKDLLSGISNTLEGFSNEPALNSAFSQSDSLFSGFKDKLKASNADVSNLDQMKPLFDIISLFNGGVFGGGLFEHGGRVMGSKRMKGRMKGIKSFLDEDVVDFSSNMKMQQVKDQFNAKYSEDSPSINEIIPGVGRNKMGDNQANGGIGGKLQSGGIPVSPRGVFDFPDEPVIVPTEKGTINMDGVNSPIFAIGEDGNGRLLPPNSGNHIFKNSKKVLEIPLNSQLGGVVSNLLSQSPEIMDYISKPTKRRRRTKRKTNQSSIPTKTMKNFNDRNRRLMNYNRKGNVGLPFGKIR